MSIASTEYEKVVERSERLAWKLNDVVPAGASLDFTKPFMPAAMFQAGSLSFLDADAKRKLNQILGNSYRHLFHFVETYIVELAMRLATMARGRDDGSVRAHLRFADEEVKHQQMFVRFGELFEKGFGTRCDLVEGAEGVAQFIHSKSPMGVLLVTLHLELVTQAHFVDSMTENSEIEPLFQSLFKHHWLEEAQHAKLDAMELIRLREAASPAEVQQAIDDYFAIAGAFAELLAGQAKNDVTSLERATKPLGPSEREAVENAQKRSYYRSFLWYGVTNKQFLAVLSEHFPAAVAGAGQAAAAFA
jgi:hypothetical protein